MFLYRTLIDPFKGPFKETLRYIPQLRGIGVSGIGTPFAGSWIGHEGLELGRMHTSVSVMYILGFRV